MRMEGLKINGCEIDSFSRTSRRCQGCQYKEYCSRKRPQAEAAKTAEQRVGELELAARTLSAAAYSSGMSAQEFNKAYWAAHSNPLNLPVALRGGLWSLERKEDGWNLL